jgi:hypothetical protein
LIWKLEVETMAGWNHSRQQSRLNTPTFVLPFCLEQIAHVLSVSPGLLCIAIKETVTQRATQSKQKSELPLGAGFAPKP